MRAGCRPRRSVEPHCSRRFGSRRQLPRELNPLVLRAFHLALVVEAALADLSCEIKAGRANATVLVGAARRLRPFRELEGPISRWADEREIWEREVGRVSGNECESHKEVLLTQPLEGRKAARLSIGSIMSSQSDGKLYGL